LWRAVEFHSVLVNDVDRLARDVTHLLRCETYAGLWHYGKCESVEPLDPVKTTGYRKSAKSARRFRPRSEWIPVELPKALQIIERDRWERVQRRLDKNRTFSPRHSKHNYLLRGLVRCGACKAGYVGEKRSGKYLRHYYRCGAECHTYQWMREEWLNDAIWNSLTNALSKADIVEEHVEKLRRLRKQGLRREGKSRREVLTRALETKELDAIDSYRNGVLSSSDLAKLLDEITRQKKAAESGQNELWTSMPAPAIRRTLSDYCHKVSESMDNASPEKRQQILRLLISEIIFEGTQARIFGALSFDYDKNDLSQPNGGTDK
jgi:site-specific DNA recombinase